MEAAAMVRGSKESKTRTYADPRVGDVSIALLAHGLGITPEQLKMLQGMQKTEEEKLEDMRHPILRSTPISAKKTVLALTEICSSNVIKNLETYSQHEEPFVKLSWDVLKDLKKKIPVKFWSNLKVIHAFINANVEELKLDCLIKKYSKNDTWTKGNVDALFAKVEEVCKNQLLKLKLRVDLDNTYCWNCPQPNTPQINVTLSHQSALMELDLCDCGIKNDTLAIIGETCAHLRCLKLGGNRSINDHGIKYLHSSSPQTPNTGNCKALEVLQLEDCKLVTHRGVASILLNLPNIEVIVLSSLEKLETLHAYGIENEKLLEIKKLKIEHAISQVLASNENFISGALRELVLIDLENQAFWANITTFAPNIKKLHIRSSENFPDLSSDENRTAQRGQQFTKFFPKFVPSLQNSNLTHLSVIGGGSTFLVDISEIAKFLPQLQVLHLGDVAILSSFKYEIQPEAFSTIETICINGIENLPSQNWLLQVLTSHNLQKYDMGTMNIPEVLLIEVIAKAKLDCNIFSKLKLIQLPPTSKFSLETWFSLITVLPNKAELVCLKFIQDNLLGTTLLKFIVRNKLDISLIYLQKKHLLL